MEIILNKLQQWKKVGIISIFLVLAFLAGNRTGFTPSQHVLSATMHSVPSPINMPVPTGVPVTVINNIIIPTQIPVAQAIVPTGASTPTQIPSTPTPTGQSPLWVSPTPSVVPTEATFTPTPTLIPTVTPTPVTESVTIRIDYAGAHQESRYTVPIRAGETAWQAVQDAVGIQNVHYTDYGGSLGIFITGFNGVDAASNQYYDFQVNGTSASTGVSSYAVVGQDSIQFVLTNF